MHFTTINQKLFFLFLALSFHRSLSQDNDDNNNNNNNNNNKDNNDSPTTGINTTPLPIHHARRDDVRIFSAKSYDYQEHGHLTMEVKDITTSSIFVKWSLPKMKYNDSVLESSIVCETSSGLIISKKNATSLATYRIENLHPDTSHFVCVYMLEKSHFSNVSVLHYSCQTLKTEAAGDSPSLRTDSIVAVVITLGYIVVMVVIGYATWRWKKKLKEQDEAKQKLAIEDDDYDEDDGMINGHIRDNNHNRGGGDGAGNNVSGAYRGSGHGYSNSVDDFSRQKERDSMRSSNHGLNNSDRVRGSSRGNNIDSIAFSDSDGCLQRASNSAEDVNGCLDFKQKRNSRGSAVKLTDVSGNGGSQERTRPPKSQSVEDSPVKVTEISF